MKKSFILVCYAFPPIPRVGGRRWAKFAKYMARKGNVVHVVSAQNLHEKASDWTMDITGNKNIHLYPVKFFLQRLITQPKAFFQKILRKALVLLLKFTKYSESFITSFPNKKVWKKVEEILVREKIDLIVVSGDPFLFYYATKIKSKYPACKIILDYRDLWNDHTFNLSFIPFTGKQRRFFETCENTALGLSDGIVTVDSYLKEVLSYRLPFSLRDKFTVISNGYDCTDYPAETSTPEMNGKLILFFAGGIPSDFNPIVTKFMTSFKELKSQLPEIYQKIEIQLSGIIDHSLMLSLQDLRLENLKLSDKLVPIATYMQRLSVADAGLVIVSPDYAHSFVTKFNDYLYLKKPIIGIGYPGKFSEFLYRHNLGLFFTMDDNLKFFIDLVGKIKSLATAPESILDSFNVELLSDAYLEFMNRVATIVSGHPDSSFSS